MAQLDKFLYSHNLTSGYGEYTCMTIDWFLSSLVVKRNVTVIWS